VVWPQEPEPQQRESQQALRALEQPQASPQPPPEAQRLPAARAEYASPEHARPEPVSPEHELPEHAQPELLQADAQSPDRPGACSRSREQHQEAPRYWRLA
jgi:hypothetical protein